MYFQPWLPAHMEIIHWPSKSARRGYIQENRTHALYTSAYLGVFRDAWQMGKPHMLSPYNGTSQAESEPNTDACYGVHRSPKRCAK